MVIKEPNWLYWLRCSRISVHCVKILNFDSTENVGYHTRCVQSIVDEYLFICSLQKLACVPLFPQFFLPSNRSPFTLSISPPPPPPRRAWTVSYTLYSISNLSWWLIRTFYFAIQSTWLPWSAIENTSLLISVKSDLHNLLLVAFTTESNFTNDQQIAVFFPQFFQRAVGFYASLATREEKWINFFLNKGWTLLNIMVFLLFSCSKFKDI